MSKLGEAAFRGVTSAATGAGVASVAAGIALPAVPGVVPVMGAIAAILALQAGRVFEAPDEPLITGTDTHQNKIAA